MKIQKETAFFFTFIYIFQHKNETSSCFKKFIILPISNIYAPLSQIQWPLDQFKKQLEKPSPCKSA